MKGISRIISEEITKYISGKCMLKEYKNPNDAETVRVCGDTLEQLYNRILQSGYSRREITMETMEKIIGEIRHLEQMMK
jgi:hypothetical protein